MATSVQIELLVDEKGAVSGIQSFGSATKAATTSTAQLDAEVKQLGANVQKLGPQSKEIDHVGEHALTSLDNVRLLRDDFGIHLPRSMEKAIASSATLSSAIKGIGAGLLGLGALQIGIAVGKQAYDGLKELWDSYLSVTKAAADYQEEVQKTRDEAFGNPTSIEDTRLRIERATEAVMRFSQQRDELLKPVWWKGFVPSGKDFYEAHQLEEKRVTAQKQLDTLNQGADLKTTHEQNVASIEIKHAGDDALIGQKKINAELQKTIELRAEDRRVEVERQRIFSVPGYDKDGNPIPGNPIDPHSGEQAEHDADEIARHKAAAETASLQRQQAQELAHLREQALEAGLRGEALYHAQEAAAIADLKFKDMDSIAARQAVHDRFHNEELRRLEDEQRETQKIVDETRLAGLTGIAHVQVQGEIRANEIKADPTLDPVERDKRVAAIQEQTAAEVAQRQLEWTQRVDQVVQDSQMRQVSGFARIAAEADKARADLQRQFDDAHAKMDLAAPGAQQIYDKDAAKLGEGIAAIDRSSDFQQSQLAEKNAQETEQIEQEAQRKSLSALKQQTAAISSEYNERVGKYADMLRRQEISQEDYDRRVAAAAMERDAEMVEAARAAREKMAGEFDSFFKSLDHPVKALADLGEKVGGEVAATLVQKLQERTGHGAADSAPSSKAGPLGLLTSILDGSAFDKRSPLPMPHAQPGQASNNEVSAQPAPQPSTTLFAWPWSHNHATPAPTPTSSPATPAPVHPDARIASSAPEPYPTHTTPDAHAATVQRVFQIGSAAIRIASASLSFSANPPAEGGSLIASVASNSATTNNSRTSEISNTEIRTASPLSGSPAAAPRFSVFPQSELASPSSENSVDRAPATASPSRIDYAGSVATQGARITPAQSSASGILGDVAEGIQLVGAAQSTFARPSLHQVQGASLSSSAAGASPLTGTRSAAPSDAQPSTPGAPISAATVRYPHLISRVPAQANVPANNAVPGAASASGTRQASATPIASSSVDVDAAAFATTGAAPASGGRSLSASGVTAWTPAASPALPQGGAGSSTVGASGSFAGTTNDYPQKKSIAGTVIGDGEQAYGLLMQGQSILGGKTGSGIGAGGNSDAESIGSPVAGLSGSMPSDGSSISSSGLDTQPDEMTATMPYATPADGSSAPTALLSPGGSNGGMLGGGGVAGNIGGAVSGGLGLFSAYEGNGGVGGGIKGAMSGMQFGSAVAGPAGAIVGAIGGAVLGAIGFGGREKARVYDLKTVRPKITGDMDSYQQGSMDYTSAYTDFQATDWQARSATGQMGPAAHAYYEDTIAKEIKTAEDKLSQEQKAGRSMYTASAASFDVGADSVPHDGMAIIHQRERILPSDQNERITSAMEAFPSLAASHAMYQTAMQSRDARANTPAGDRNLNMTVHAIDAKGVAQMFDQHKHLIRAALNNSYAENSGGGIA